MKIEQNISRLEYLLKLYNINIQELLSIISKGLKNPILEEDILSEEIEVNYLKRIDKVFNKGLHYYLDPKVLEATPDSSIFFRKSKFGVDLNLGAKKIVNHFEDLKISLSAITKLAELDVERSLPIFKISDNPREIAFELRAILYPGFNSTLKEFLKSLIGKFADNNILVFEFVETWNKKDKANIDGFFLKPNVIVLKRQQSSFRREIFTIIHELGHYLLNEEEVEQLEIQNIANINLTSIEKWCNDFSYFFLIGEYDKLIENIVKADVSNDFHSDIIEEISENTNLSKIALYSRLLYLDKISRENYFVIKKDFEVKYLQKLKDEKKKKEIDKLKGIKTKGSAPKPINSPLLISTIQSAFYEGLINEYDVCKTLNIKPNKLANYIQ